MDVWSLGVTLYAMLAVELPFEGLTNEKKRSNIINCRWAFKPFFSARVNKLLNSIFVDASSRISLQELSNSEFLSSYQMITSNNFINYQNEMIVPEEQILTLAELECRVDRNKVIDSLKAFRLDKYKTIYYLLLKR